MSSRIAADKIGRPSSHVETLIASQRTTLDDLTTGIKDIFPAEAGAIFIPNDNDGITSYSIFPTNSESNLTLDNSSFLGDRLELSNGIPMRFHTPTTLNDSEHYFETRGLEEILKIIGLKRDQLTGAVDFRLKLDTSRPDSYLSGIILNPLDPGSGAATRERVRFNEQDPKRVRDFLDLTRRKLQEISAARSEGERVTLAEMFGVPHGYIEQPSRGGWEVVSHMAQLDHPFGGDIIDGFLAGENSAVYTSGDIVGHGLRTAKLNYDLRQRQRHFESDGIHSPGEQVSKINNVARNSTIGDIPMTMTMYIALRTRTSPNGKRGIVDYADAGCGGYLIRTNGNIEELAGSVPIGVTETIYETKRKYLNPGDIIFAGSDGYKEAKNDEKQLYGISQLKNLLVENRTRSPRQILELLEENVREFTAERRGWPHYDDDRSATVIKYLGE